MSLGLFACSQNEPKEKQVKGFVLNNNLMETTQLYTVSGKSLKRELKFFGKITPDNNKLLEVYPIVGGNVVKVYRELGDYVKKGELLATIRSAEVAGYEKELFDAQNDIEVSENELKVAEELFEGKLNAETDVIAARNKLKKAKSQLKRVEETYKIYNVKPGAIYEVISPISGFILQKNINQDMQLRTDRSDNIFDVAQLDDIWAIANINESDIPKIHLGMDAEVITLSYPDKIFRGKVDKIFNVIDPATKAMKVRITLHNHEYLLKPEMRASITLSSVDSNTVMPAVPTTAIIFDKSQNFVLVFKDSAHIETRPVKIFSTIGQTVYLKSGLSEGEKVITSNQLLIYDALND